MERLQRHHYSPFTYDDPSDHRSPNQPSSTPHVQQQAIHDTTPTTKIDTLVHPTTISPATHSHPLPAYECPLTGNILHLNIPPNAHVSFIFVILSMVAHTILLRCNVLRHRRELNFLLHLQNQIHTKTTTISEAARHCKTSEAAIKAWLHHYNEFANGPAADGDDD
jgi:hypothetical protein